MPHPRTGSEGRQFPDGGEIVKLFPAAIILCEELCEQTKGEEGTTVDWPFALRVSHPIHPVTPGSTLGILSTTPPSRFNGPWMSVLHDGSSAGSRDTWPAGWGGVKRSRSRDTSSVNIDLRIVRWVAYGRRTVVDEPAGVQDKTVLLAGRFQCFECGIARASRPIGVVWMTDCCGNVSTVRLGPGSSTSRLGMGVASGRERCI